MAKVKMHSPRWCNGAAANQRKVVSAVDAAANEIAGRAKANLAAHRDTGNSEIVVENHVKGKYGHLDSLVHFQDPDSDEPGNVLAIEFGIKNHPWSHKPVHGLGVLRQAAGLL